MDAALEEDKENGWANQCGRLCEVKHRTTTKIVKTNLKIQIKLGSGQPHPKRQLYNTDSRSKLQRIEVEDDEVWESEVDRDYYGASGA